MHLWYSGEHSAFHKMIGHALCLVYLTTLIELIQLEWIRTFQIYKGFKISLKIPKPRNKQIIPLSSFIVHHTCRPKTTVIYKLLEPKFNYVYIISKTTTESIYIYHINNFIYLSKTYLVESKFLCTFCIPKTADSFYFFIHLGRFFINGISLGRLHWSYQLAHISWYN